MIFLLARSAGAAAPNGLDCDRFGEIPASRCSDWKARNPKGRLWCHWNLKTGALDSIYGHAEPAVAPGLDFTKITRESARSDNATRSLLEAYGRQQIRAFESLFGFKPQGYELALTDFMRRPGGVHRVVNADGTIQNTPLPAISTLHFQQMVHQFPLEGASLEMQVDDANNLVSVFSHFAPNLPASVPPHHIPLSDAIQSVTDALAPGVALGSDDSITGFASYTLIAGQLVPTFQIRFVVGGRDLRVVVDGGDGHVLKQINELLDFDPPGFTDGSGRYFVDHPPFEDCSNADPTTGVCPGSPSLATVVRPEFYVAALQDQPIGHLRIPPTGGYWRLDGYFVRVDDGANPNWETSSPDFRLESDYWALRIDTTPADNDNLLNPTTGLYDECNAVHGFPHRETCRIDPNASPTPTPVAADCPLPLKNGPLVPDMLLGDNAIWEQRFDQLTDYAYVDQAGEYFRSRHSHVLTPSVTGDAPAIQVVVHASDNGGGFFPGYKGRAGGAILVASNTCWRLLSGGNDAVVFVGQPERDFYSWSNPGRDRGSMWHEFTHGVVWDLTHLDSDGFGAPFNEAVADFFPASVLTDNGDLSPWRLGDWELDPYTATGHGEIDWAYPGSFRGTNPILDPEESHAEGRPWSSFLWDVRKRATILKASFTNATIDEHAVEDLEFEALTRTPKRLDELNPTGDFQPGAADALQRLLDADARLTGKQLSYDILSSAARHGIKLDPYIAAVEADRYNYQMGGSPLTFRLFTGANPNYVIRFSTDPIGVVSPSKTTAAVITLSGMTHAIPADLGHSTANLTDTVTLTSADLDPLLAGASGPVPLYYLLETFTEQTSPPDPSLCPDISNCNIRLNLIPGAGFTFADQDLPAVILLPPGVGPACRCDMRPSNHVLARNFALLLLPIGFAWFRRRRRA